MLRFATNCRPFCVSDKIIHLTQIENQKNNVQEKVIDNLHEFDVTINYEIHFMCMCVRYVCEHEDFFIVILEHVQLIHECVISKSVCDVRMFVP